MKAMPCFRQQQCSSCESRLVQVSTVIYFYIRTTSGTLLSLISFDILTFICFVNSFSSFVRAGLGFSSVTKRNGGRGCKIFRIFFEVVRFNDIRVTREWLRVKFTEKSIM